MGIWYRLYPHFIADVGIEKLGYIGREKGEQSPDGSIPCHIYPLKKYPNVNNYTRADVNSSDSPIVKTYYSPIPENEQTLYPKSSNKRKSIKKEIERESSVSDDTHQ